MPSNGPTYLARAGTGYGETIHHRGSMRSPILISGLLLFCACAENQVLLSEPEPHAPAVSLRQLHPSASISLASSSPPIAEYDYGRLHVRVYQLGNDAEVEVTISTSGLSLASASGQIVYIIARNDTIFGMDQSRQILVTLPGAVNTSAVRDPNDADSLLYNPTGGVQLQEYVR